MNHHQILKKYNISAKKSLGQNFLTNDAILEKIVSYLSLTWKKVVEVWPGYWALTEKILAKNPEKLTLIELDSDMVRIIFDRLSSGDLKPKETQIDIKNTDVLTYVPEDKEYIVVANIPYYITSPILRHFFFDASNRPTDMLLLMQKDVWDKICKKDGKSSVISLFADFACSEVKEIIKVSKNNFVPAPKIESSVMYFKLREDSEFGIDRERFFKIIKIAFAQKRKKLISNLSSIFPKDKLKEIFIQIWLDEEARAEDLNLEKWVELVKKLDL